jgi:ABC transport system ATP-binding/permease protein
MERAVHELALKETTLNEQMAENATDHSQLAALQSELERTVAEREALETSWLEASEALEG